MSEKDYFSDDEVIRYRKSKEDIRITKTENQLSNFERKIFVGMDVKRMLLNL